ncbi:SDR family NAD(P)-dependent oxidoreductase [Variovorax paradoxus]|uniref:SDR family NAD(P)-dependent oxidoreductase n=1 Tax=Variovorax paradoxus TaxID=34073 RepID=UPI001931C49B|nr:SDR family NAD(P)-dependent oxidoreductase [Variovorax paradoxus]
MSAANANPAPRILVTGATGRLGRLLVPRLRERGAVVRAFTRQVANAAALADQSRHERAPFEVAVGDLEDRASLRRAFEGVSHLFLLSPIVPELAAQQIAAIEAAAEAGVRRIVKLSGSHWTIEPPGRSLSGDAHARIEAALAASGIAHRVLRPNAWTQVVLTRLAAELAAGDVLHAPPGLPRVAYIDARDIADVAVEALLNDADDAPPGPWVLTGARAVDHGELARIAAGLSGRPVVAEPLSPQELAARQAQAPSPYIAQVHAQFAALIGAGEAATVTDTVERVLGRPPRRIEDFVAESLAA